MPETVAWMVETHPSQRTDMVRFRAQQRRVETTNAVGKNMAVQASNIPIAEQEPARLTARQVADIVARYAPIARRTEGVTTGDVAAGLRYEMASLGDARMSAMSRLFPDE